MHHPAEQSSRAASPLSPDAQLLFIATRRLLRSLALGRTRQQHAASLAGLEVRESTWAEWEDTCAAAHERAKTA